MSGLGRLELVACVLGVYATFLTWGILQERVTTTNYNGEYFKFYVFLNLCQSTMATLLAYGYSRWKGGLLQDLPKKLVQKFLMISVLNSLASPFGYASLKFINYPTLILGKSCKLIPVMAMGKILHGKSYPLYKYASVGLITLGVCGFMLGKSSKSKDSGPSVGFLGSAFGLLLVLVNLTIDGVTNSTQDVMFKQFDMLTGPVLMLYMNLFSSMLMAGYLIVSNAFTGELSRTIGFCRTHPSVWSDIFLFSLCGGLGQLFIFYTLEKFGSLVLVTVTVTRKMLSIVLSVLWFGHQLSTQQWLSVAISFAGIAFEDVMRLLAHYSLVDAAKWGIVSKHAKKEKKDDDVESESGHSGRRRLEQRGRTSLRRLPINNLPVPHTNGSVNISPSRAANKMEKGL
jgi:UDP-galactose transporter B1